MAHVLIQLEVLDTAGAEQFTSMNEYYIKVCIFNLKSLRRAVFDLSSSFSPSSSRPRPFLGNSEFDIGIPLNHLQLRTAITVWHDQGSAGFILVFSLTQASSMREVDALRQQIFRIKGHPPPPSFSLEPTNNGPPASPNGNFGASSVRLRPPSSDGHGPTSNSMRNQDSSSSFDTTRPSTPAKGSLVPGGGRRHMGRPVIRRPGSSNGEGEKLRGWTKKPGSNRTSDEAEPSPMIFDPNDKYHHIPATKDSSSIPLVIVGTKSDLMGEREVSREMAIRWALPSFVFTPDEL